jgi:endoglucanase
MREKQGSPAAGAGVHAAFAALFVALVCGLAGAGEKQGVDPFLQNQKLGRGVNILGYDPIWNSRDKARFKAGYFRML